MISALRTPVPCQIAANFLIVIDLHQNAARDWEYGAHQLNSEHRKAATSLAARNQLNTTQVLHFPLALPFFLILVTLFLFVFFLLPLKLMKYAYEQLGVSSAGAVLLLLGSLIGS